MTLKLNGSSSGSVSIDAPASTTGGADVALTLPVNDGDANQVLQTNGSGTLSWVTLDNTPSWGAHMSTALNNLTSGTWYTLVCDTELWDTDSAYDPSTGKFTVPAGKGGKYQINASWSLDDPASSFGLIAISKTPDGGSLTELHRVLLPGQTGWNSSWPISCVIDLDPADVLEIRIRQVDAGNSQDVEADMNHTWWQGFRLLGIS